MTNTHNDTHTKDQARNILGGTFLIVIGMSLILVWILVMSPIMDYLVAQDFFARFTRMLPLVTLCPLWTLFITGWTACLIYKGVRRIGGKA